MCTTFSFNESKLKTELTILNKLFESNGRSNNQDVLENRINFFKKNGMKGAFENYNKCLKIFLSIPTNTARES